MPEPDPGPSRQNYKILMLKMYLRAQPNSQEFGTVTSWHILVINSVALDKTDSLTLINLL